MKVKWAGLEYEEIKKRGYLPDIQEHIKNQLKGIYQAEYIMYLIEMCKFPKDYNPLK